uniref:Large ribosomal subunit protein bL19m n=1 Tax=Meleagris gallopavo TaxID=9103 RepID=G1NNB1_MELGA
YPSSCASRVAYVRLANIWISLIFLWKCFCFKHFKFGFSYRFLSPEFIPPRGRTDPLKFYIERKDMVQRRKVFNIPEFYVGSILAVTTADPYADGKTNRFVGICIQRGGRGLGATFVLRNVIEDQGVEICYELYSPRIQEITVLKLEKRLDDNLMYLRDALPEYSTFDMNMKPVCKIWCLNATPVVKTFITKAPPFLSRQLRDLQGVTACRFLCITLQTAQPTLWKLNAIDLGGGRSKICISGGLADW